MFEQDLVLKKNDVSLRTLKDDDELSLMSVAQHPTLWQYQVLDFTNAVIFKQQWFDKAMRRFDDKTRWPFVVLCDSKIIGSSSFYDISERHKRLTIGYTWYHPEYWGTHVNPTVKYLMLSYVFDTLQFHRASFSVDAINQQSQRALEKLGIAREGLLKSHIIRADGTQRDSWSFAVTKTTWPAIKSRLESKIYSHKTGCHC